MGYSFFGLNSGPAPDQSVSVLKFPDGLILNDPIVFENFDGGTEFDLESVGWSGTHYTDRIAGHEGAIPDDPQSDSYLGWALLERTRLESVFPANRLEVAPAQQFNGDPVTELLSGNFFYAESDRRSGNQVQTLLSPTYNFTGQQNLVLAFNSAYHQNQDSFGAIEYTIDRGATWHPIIYMIDQADIIRSGDGTVDAVATLNTAYGDVAVYTNPNNGQQIDGSYGAFISAPVSQALAPYIDGRVNDDAVESKRLEAFRIPLADEQSTVQFRIIHTGTSSWYWGLDNWGIYKVPTIDSTSVSLGDFSGGPDLGIDLMLTTSAREQSAFIDLGSAPPPAPEVGSDAEREFGVDLSTAGLTELAAGKLHQITISGLNPDNAYDLTLYSDLAQGAGATGTELSYTLISAVSFLNTSSIDPALSTISGTSDRTTTIDITDNSAPGRGFISQFSTIRSGTDGSIRVQFESSQTACLTALKLAENTPTAVAVTTPAEVTETSATVQFGVGVADTQHLYLYWGKSDGGEDVGNWDDVVDLGESGQGNYSHLLADLETFSEYFYVLHAVGTNGETWTTVESFRPQSQGLLYATGFEPGEPAPFVPGSLHGQGLPGMWRVGEGNAVVQGGTASSGLQAVQAGECIIDVAFSDASDVLWVDAFFIEAGTTNQPIVPTNVVSSVLFFSSSDGILALDGDGIGGGSFVPVVPDYPKDQFIRVSIRNDYVNKVYDVWIDGVLSRGGLKFKDNSVQAFSGARRRSVQSNYMDDFSISIWGLDADSDGDGLVDLDEAKFYGSYPLLADSDRDGAGDGLELQAGTNPSDASSLFAIKIDVNQTGDKLIRIPTITGLQYTLQRKEILGEGDWQDVQGAVNLLGDGQDKTFLETPDGENFFYRGVIINR